MNTTLRCAEGAGGQATDLRSPELGSQEPASVPSALPPCDWCLSEVLSALHEDETTVDRATVRYAGKFSCAFHAWFYWAPDVDHALPAEEWIRRDFLWDLGAL